MSENSSNWIDIQKELPKDSDWVEIMYYTGLIEKARYIKIEGTMYKAYWEDEQEFYIVNVNAIKLWRKIK